MQPSALLNFPSSVEVSDAFSVTGSGVGNGSNSIKTAIGEYFERRHFYREILPKKRGFLYDFLTGEEVLSFVNAFVQTASKKCSTKDIEGHEFYLSEVLRSCDFSKCFIPTVCISLSSCKLESDNYLYPLRDTCGCSFHWDEETAFLSAVKEYLERQFLLKFWLTKQCRALVSVAEVRDLLQGKKAWNLYSVLGTSGEVSVFDISDSRFPGVCILVAYGQNGLDHHVRYCAGMSYASQISEAIEKSLLELWQTYRFMDLFIATDSSENEIKDPYLQHFFACNFYETYKEVVDALVVGSQIVKPVSAFTVSGLLSVLNAQGVSGYFYASKSFLNGVDCIFCKFISPDLFLHMNNSKCINLKNKYSKAFATKILPSRAAKMVPFP